MGRGEAIHSAMVAAILVASFGAHAAERANVRLRGEAQRKRVEKVLDGAALRFGTAGCADVLSAFSDGSGRPLADVLTASAPSAPAYLDTIFFYDGSQEGRCGKKWILAVATPGTRVVKICPAFYQASLRDPVDAEATLIHEALHTLGLGENPPSSREITAQVLKHCR